MISRSYPMRVYLFVSERDTNVSAFTSDDTGGNLPADYGPWRALNGGRGMFLGSVSDRIAITVKLTGYFLVTGRSRKVDNPHTF